MALNAEKGKGDGHESPLITCEDFNATKSNNLQYILQREAHSSHLQAEPKTYLFPHHVSNHCMQAP